MARRCKLTGKDVQSGNNVSHSNRKTRRRFLPNIQSVSLMSEILGRSISMRISAAAVRTVEHNGGLDNYLLTARATNLTVEATTLKRKIKRALAKKAA